MVDKMPHPDSHHLYSNSSSSNASLPPVSGTSLYHRSTIGQHQAVDHHYHHPAQASQLHRHHAYGQHHPLPAPLNQHSSANANAMHESISSHYHHSVPSQHHGLSSYSASLSHQHHHIHSSPLPTATSAAHGHFPVMSSAPSNSLTTLTSVPPSPSATMIVVGGGGAAELPSHIAASHGAAASDAAARVRAYRSRKDRPCDHCRKRKSRCIIEVAGQDCQSCHSQGKRCTFDMSPTPRSRPVKNEDGITIASAIVPNKRSHSQRQESNHSSPTSSSARQQASSVAATVSKTEDEQRPHVQRRRTTTSSSSASAAALENAVSSSSFTTVSNHRRRSSQLFTELDGSPEVGSRATSFNQHGHHQMHDEEEQREKGNRATTDQLYGYISAMMYGRDGDGSERACSPGSNAGNDAHDVAGTTSATADVDGVTAKDRHNQADDGGDEINVDSSSVAKTSDDEEQKMMPVALGSSSSEDPQLLRQAGSSDSSSSVSRHGNGGGSSAAVGATSPPNDHMSCSSKTTMPPPPTPEVQNNAAGSSSSGLRPLQVRQVTSDPHHPVFFAYVPANPYGRKGSPREIGSQGLSKLKVALQGRLGELMVLYSQRDSAAFPLLMESQRRKFRQAAIEACETPANVKVPLPDVLSIGALAAATVYDVGLRSISKRAWGLSLHALMEQFEISNLTTLQVALTDLTGRPSINASGNFMTFNQTLAVGHMLGLHLDPTGWNVTREEKDIRIRLWWATIIHDKWSSLCWGRPSTIHQQDYTTPLPRSNRLSPCQEHLEDKDLASFKFGRGWYTCPNAHTPGDTFSALCRLTLILSDILSEFHSVRSSHKAHRDAYTVAQRIKAFFIALEDWKDMQPETLRCVLKLDEQGAKGTHSIPGTRSLQLSYLGVNLLLCRTALDSVTTRGIQDSSRLITAHQAALHGATMVVEFLESLNEEDYGGFFLHYGSHHLAFSLSLLARLCFGFSSLGNDDLLQTCIATMQRLLVVLSEAHRTNKWDLAELALTRSRAILPTLESRIPEFPRLFCTADDSVMDGVLGGGVGMPRADSALYTNADSNEAEKNGARTFKHLADVKASSVSEKFGSLATRHNTAVQPVALGDDQESGMEAADIKPQRTKFGSQTSDQQTAMGNAIGPYFADSTALAMHPGNVQHQQHQQQQQQQQQSTASMRLQAAVNAHHAHNGMVHQSNGGTGHANVNSQHNLPASSMMNEFQFMAADGSGAAIPYDAVGVPYPLTNVHVSDLGNTSNNASSSSLVNGSAIASHLLSGVEVDWLGIGLQPNTYPDSFLIGPNGNNHT